jgi:hypothetical protein
MAVAASAYQRLESPFGPVAVVAAAAVAASAVVAYLDLASASEVAAD